MIYKIAIGTDHRGFELKECLIQTVIIDECMIEWIDCGAYNNKSSDYPVFANQVCQKIVNQEADYGILLCGTGIGMAIAANRHKTIRAGLVWNAEVARLAKEDDDCNVLVFSADNCDLRQVQKIIAVWLTASFKEGRYAKRIALLDYHSV